MSRTTSVSAAEPEAGGGRCLKTPEAAEFLGVSPSFLEKLRVKGGGPAYAVLGRRIVYTIENLERFVAARTRAHTSAGGRS